MKNGRRVTILACAALVLAVAASLLLAFLPLYESVSMNSSSQQASNSSATLIQVNGYGVLIPLAIPPILTAVNLLAARLTRRGSRPSMWSLTALLTIFVIIGGFSIGLFYTPAALIMIAAAILTNSGAADQSPTNHKT